MGEAQATIAGNIIYVATTSQHPKTTDRANSEQTNCTEEQSSEIIDCTEGDNNSQLKIKVSGSQSDEEERETWTHDTIAEMARGGNIRAREIKGKLTADALDIDKCIKDTQGRGALEMVVNCNGFGKYMSQMKAKVGNFYEAIRRRKPDKIWITEAHMATINEREEIEGLLESTIGGRWTVFIAPCWCNGAKKYAGTLAAIKLEQGEDRNNYQAFRAIDGDGVPRSKHPEAGKADNGRSLKHANHEGRILYVQSHRERDLHDTILVYATNTQARQKRLEGARNLAHDIARLKSWHKRTHPNRVLTCMGDINALAKLDDIYIQDKPRVRGQKTLDKTQQAAGALGIPSLLTEEIELVHQVYDKDAVNMMEHFARGQPRLGTSLIVTAHLTPSKEKAERHKKWCDERKVQLTHPKDQRQCTTGAMRLWLGIRKMLHTANSIARCLTVWQRGWKGEEPQCKCGCQQQRWPCRRSQINNEYQRSILKISVAETQAWNILKHSCIMKKCEGARIGPWRRDHPSAVHIKPERVAVLAAIDQVFTYGKNRNTEDSPHGVSMTVNAEFSKQMHPEELIDTDHSTTWMRRETTEQMLLPEQSEEVNIAQTWTDQSLKETEQTAQKKRAYALQLSIVYIAASAARTIAACTSDKHQQSSAEEKFSRSMQTWLQRDDMRRARCVCREITTADALELNMLHLRENDPTPFASMRLSHLTPAEATTERTTLQDSFNEAAHAPWRFTCQLARTLWKAANQPEENAAQTVAQEAEEAGESTRTQVTAEALQADNYSLMRRKICQALRPGEVVPLSQIIQRMCTQQRITAQTLKQYWKLESKETEGSPEITGKVSKKQTKAILIRERIAAKSPLDMVTQAVKTAIKQKTHVDRPVILTTATGMAVIEDTTQEDGKLECVRRNDAPYSRSDKEGTPMSANKRQGTRWLGTIRLRATNLLWNLMWNYRPLRVRRKGGARMNNIHIERLELQALIHKGMRQVEKAYDCGTSPRRYLTTNAKALTNHRRIQLRTEVYMYVASTLVTQLTKGLETRVKRGELAANEDEYMRQTWRMLTIKAEIALEAAQVNKDVARYNTAYLTIMDPKTTLTETENAEGQRCTRTGGRTEDKRARAWKLQQHSEGDVQGRLQFNTGQYITGNDRRAWSIATDRESAGTDIDKCIREEENDDVKAEDIEEEQTSDKTPQERRGETVSRRQKNSDCKCIHCFKALGIGKVKVSGGASPLNNSPEEDRSAIKVDPEAATVNIPHATSTTEPTTAPFQPYYAWVCVGNRENVDDRVWVYALLDTGCSITVASKRLKERLLRETNITVEQHETGTAPTAASAFGEVKVSDGRLRLGITIPNAAYENGTAPLAEGYMDKTISPDIFEDICSDLIIGIDVLSGNDWYVTSQVDAPTTAHGNWRFTDHTSEGGKPQTVDIPFNVLNKWPERAWALASTSTTTMTGAEVEIDALVHIPQGKKGRTCEADTCVEVQPLHSSENDNVPFTIIPSISKVTQHDDGTTTVKVKMAWHDKQHRTKPMRVPPGIPIAQIHRVNTDETEICSITWLNPQLQEEVRYAMQARAQHFVHLLTNTELPTSIQQEIQQGSSQFSAYARTRWKEINPTATTQWTRSQLSESDQRTQQCLDIAQKMTTLLAHGTLNDLKDWQAVGRMLTFVATVVELMPQCTQAALHHEGWKRVFAALDEAQDSGATSALEARERLFQLMRADAAGLRAHEHDSMACINPTGEIIDTNLRTGANLAPSAITCLRGTIAEVNQRFKQTNHQNVPATLRTYNRQAWEYMSQGHSLVAHLTTSTPVGGGARQQDQAQTASRAHPIYNINFEDPRKVKTKGQANSWSETGSTGHINYLQRCKRDDRERLQEILQRQTREYTSPEETAGRERINQLTKEVAEERASSIQEKRRLIEEAAEADKGAFVEQNEREDDRDGKHNCTYTKPETKIPKIISDEKLWWFPEKDSEAEGHLHKSIKQLKEAQQAFLTNIEWPNEGEIIEVSDTATDEERKLARREERALIHTAVRKLVIERMPIWEHNPWDSPTIKSLVYDETFLTLTTKHSLFEPPRPLAPDAADEALEMVEELVRTNLAFEQPSSFNHNVMLVPKPMARGDTKKKWRMVSDLRLLNSFTCKLNWRLQPTWASLEQAANHERYMCSDCQQGYYLVRLDPAISHKFSFSVGSRRLCSTKALMGALNSGSVFTLALYFAVGRMERGASKLCLRNKYIKTHKRETEAAKKRYREGVRVLQPCEQELTPANSSKQTNAWIPETQEEKELQEWVERSYDRHRPTVEDLEKGDFEWHECDGVQLDDLEHEDICLTYVDDLITAYRSSAKGSKGEKITQMESRTEFIKSIERVADQLLRHGCMMKAQKTSVFVTSLSYLGFTLSIDGLQPAQKKLNAFQNAARPESKQDVQRLLGALQYYRKSVPGISQHESVLYDLCKSRRTWEWEQQHESAFQYIKEIMAADNILTPFDASNTEPLVCIVDSSTLGVGAVMCMTMKNGEERPCMFESCAFKAGTSWSATQIEMKGILWALKRMAPYIRAANKRKVRVVTDHKPIRDIIKKRDLNRALHAMVLEIQDTPCIIEWRDSTKVAVADYLSRSTAARRATGDGQGGEHNTGQVMNTTMDDETERAAKKSLTEFGAGFKRLGLLQGPKEHSASDKPLTQGRRRMVRMLMGHAKDTLEKQKQAASEQERMLTIITKALQEGMQEREDGTPTPVEAGKRIEDRALLDLGGFETLVHAAFGDFGVNDLKEKFGEDYFQKMCLISAEDTKGERIEELHVMEITEGQPLTNILKEEGVQTEGDSPMAHSFIVEVKRIASKIQTPATAGEQEWDESTMAEIDMLIDAQIQHSRENEDRESTHEEQSAKAPLSRETREIFQLVIQDRIEMHQMGHDTHAHRSAQEEFPTGGELRQNTPLATYVPPTATDLFTGAGGGLAGALDAGFEAGCVCDKGDAQQRALKKRYGLNAIHNWDSVKAHHIRGSYCVLSGSPCPAFSKAGAKGGWSDPRSRYYPLQFRSATECNTPVLLAENVEEVLEEMPTGRYTGTTGHNDKMSPYNALKQELEKWGYTVKYRCLDAGQVGGNTRRPRVIVQAHSKAQVQDLQQRVTDRQQFLQEHGLELSHDMDDDNFIWPKHGPVVSNIAHLLDPWCSVPDSYKLPFRRWGEFGIKQDNFNGVKRWGLRPNDNGIGKFTDANRLNAADYGIAPGMTAAGNTGWYTSFKAGKKGASKFGIRRLQGHECLRIAGFTEKHSLDLADGSRDPSFTESERFEMANNAICVELSRAIFKGVRAYYDTEWFKGQIKEQERLHPEWERETELAKARTMPRHEPRQQTTQDSPYNSDEEEEDESRLDVETGTLGTHEQDTTSESLSPEAAHREWQRMRNESERLLKARISNAIDTNTIRAAATIRRHLKCEPVQCGGGSRSHTNTDEDSNRDVTRVVEILPHKGAAYKRKVVERDPFQTNTDMEKHLDTSTKQAWKELRAKQRMDEMYRIIMDYVSKGDIPLCPIERSFLKTKEEYMVKSGVLYHLAKPTTRQKEWTAQVCIPRSMQTNLVEKYHDSLGHIAEGSLIKVLYERYWWPRLAQDCGHICSDCDKCQRFKDVKPPAGTVGQTQITETASEPMECLWLDYIGPYGSKDAHTGRGNKCVLIIMDDFTRWMKLYALPQQTSAETAACIEDFTANWGWPRTIKSDRGSNLVSGALQELYARMNVNKRESASVHAQGHALVERGVKHVQSALRTTLAGNEEWDKALNQVATAWNCVPKTAFGASPYQLLYGRTPRFMWQDVMPDVSHKWSEKEWLNKALTRLRESWLELERQFTKYKLEYLRDARRRWKDRKTEEFEPGERVRVYLPVVPTKGMATKLAARYTTEYEVVRKVGKYTYRLRKMHTSNRHTVPIHVSRIKLQEGRHNKRELTPLTSLEESDNCVYNYGDEHSQITETYSDAIVGAMEPEEGESESELEERRCKVLMEKGLATSQAEALGIIRRIGNELESNIQQGEEFVLTNNEADLEEGNSTRKDVSPKKTVVDTGHELCADTLDMTQQHDEQHHHQDADQIRDDDNDPLQGGETSVVESYPGKAVKTRQMFKNIADKWKIDPNVLADLNDRWIYREIAEDLYIPAKTILQVPKDMMEEMYTEDKLGDHWKRVYKIERIEDDRTRKGKNKEDKTVIQKEYLVRWDQSTLQKGDKVREWIPEWRIGNAREEIQRYKNERAAAKSVRAVYITKEYSRSKAAQALIREDKTGDNAHRWKQIEALTDEQKAQVNKMRSKHEHVQDSIITWPRTKQRTPQEVQMICTMANSTAGVHNTAGWVKVGRVNISITPEAKIGISVENEDKEDVAKYVFNGDNALEAVHSGMERVRQRQARKERAEQKEDEFEEVASDGVTAKPAETQVVQEGITEHAFARIITRGRSTAKDASVTESLHKLIEGCRQGRTRILDIREIKAEISQEQSDLLRTVLEESDIWGIIIGGMTDISKILYEEVLADLPPNITHVGMMTPRDKKMKDRYLHIKNTCTRHRREASRRFDAKIKTDATNMSQCRFMWGTAKHPYKIVEEPRKPKVEDIDKFMKQLHTPKCDSWKEQKDTWDDIHKYLCTIYGLRYTNTVDTYMDVPTSFYSAVHIVAYHLEDSRKRGKAKPMAIHSIEGAVTKMAATIQGERTATDMLPQGPTAEEQTQKKARRTRRQQEAARKVTAVLTQQLSRASQCVNRWKRYTDLVKRMPQMPHSVKTLPKVAICVICFHDSKGKVKILTTDKGDIPEIPVFPSQKDCPRLWKQQVTQAARASAEVLTGQTWEQVGKHLAVNSPVRGCIFSATASILGNHIAVRGSTALMIMTITDAHTAREWTQRNHNLKWSADGVEAYISETAKTHIVSSHTATVTAKASNFANITVVKQQNKEVKILARQLIRPGMVIGDLTTGSTEMSEAKYSQMRQQDNHKTAFHSYATGMARYFMKTSDSDIIWHMKHTATTPNCEVRENGTVQSLTPIWPGEVIQARYHGMIPQHRRHAVKGGDNTATPRNEEVMDLEHHYSRLNNWSETQGAVILWKELKQMCQYANMTITIGYNSAVHTRQADLAECLDSHIKDCNKDNRTEKQHTEMLKGLTADGAPLEKVLTAGWEIIRDMNAHRSILANERGNIDRSEDYEVTLGKFAVNSMGAAKEWKSLYTRMFGIDTVRVFSNRNVYLNFFMTMSFEEERADRAKQPEHTIKAAEAIWTELEAQKTQAIVRVPTTSLGRGKADPTVDSEVRINCTDSTGQSHSATGMITEMQHEGAYTRILVSVGVTNQEMIRAETVDITPVWRSPTAMRQRRALQRMWVSAPPEHEFKRQVIMGEKVDLHREDMWNSIQNLERQWERIDSRSNPLTKTQQAAADSVFSKALTNVWGPPGVGKTLLVRYIASRFAFAQRQQARGLKGKKVIIATPSNKTIEDLIGALKDVWLPDGSRLRACWVVARSWERNIPEHIEPYTLTNIVVNPPAGWKGADTSTQSFIQQKLKTFHEKRAASKAPLSQQMEAQYMMLMKQEIKRVLKEADVLIMTTSQTGLKQIRDIPTSIQILDEAGQVTELNLNTVLDITSNAVVCVGDAEQLPAMHSSPWAQRLGLTSGFERIIKQDGKDPIMLENVWRHIKNSVTFNNKLIYDSRLKFDPTNEARLLKQIVDADVFRDPQHPKAWIQVTSDKGELHPEGSRSWLNEDEAKACATVTNRIITQGIKPSDIVVITMYTGQEQELKRQFSKCEALKQVAIHTVDSSQGKEWNLVIVSPTRTRERATGFCTDLKRINVMTTRHKWGTIIIGSPQMRTAQAHWKELIADFETGGLKPELTPQILVGGGEDITGSKAEVCCITVPCKVCWQAKAEKMFTKETLIDVTWSTDNGFTAISKGAVNKGHVLTIISKKELERQSMLAQNENMTNIHNFKRSPAWTIGQSDVTNVDIKKGTVTATRNIKKGEVLKSKSDPDSDDEAREQKEVTEGTEELTEKQREQELQAQQKQMKERRKKGGCVVKEIERREKLKNLREKIRKISNPEEIYTLEKEVEETGIKHRWEALMDKTDWDAWETIDDEWFNGPNRRISKEMWNKSQVLGEFQAPLAFDKRGSKATSEILAHMLLIRNRHRELRSAAVHQASQSIPELDHDIDMQSHRGMNIHQRPEAEECIRGSCIITDIRDSRILRPHVQEQITNTGTLRSTIGRVCWGTKGHPCEAQAMSTKHERCSRCEQKNAEMIQQHIAKLSKLRGTHKYMSKESVESKNQRGKLLEAKSQDQEAEERDKFRLKRAKRQQILAVMATVLDQTDLEIDTNGLGTWMKEALTTEERLEVATDFCNGKCRINPTLFDMKTDLKADKEIADNRQRLTTQGRNIQAIRAKNCRSDVGEREASTNRNKMKVYNEELKTFVNALHCHKLWKSARRKLSKEVWQRTVVTAPENKELVNKWVMACCETDEKHGDRWFYSKPRTTNKGYTDFRRCMEEKLNKPYTKALAESLKRMSEVATTEEEAKLRQEAIHMRMATTAHATLRMEESNERMRSLLDELQITEIHEQGLKTEYAHLREPMMAYHPYEGSLKHHTNLHGQMGSDEFTTGKEYRSRESANKTIDMHDALEDADGEEINALQTQQEQLTMEDVQRWIIAAQREEDDKEESRQINLITNPYTHLHRKMQGHRQRENEFIAGAKIISTRKKAKHGENMSVWSSPQERHTELEGMDTRTFEMRTPCIVYKNNNCMNWQQGIYRKSNDAFITQNIVIKLIPDMKQYQYSEQWTDKRECVDNFSVVKPGTGTQWWGCLWADKGRIENEESHPDFNVMQLCAGGLFTNSKMQDIPEDTEAALRYLKHCGDHMEYSEMLVTTQQVCNGTEIMQEWMARTTEGVETYHEKKATETFNKVLIRLAGEEPQINEINSGFLAENVTKFTLSKKQDPDIDETPTCVQEADTPNYACEEGGREEEREISTVEEVVLDLPQKEEKDASEEHLQQIDEENAPMTAEETIATIAEPEAEASKEETVENVTKEETVEKVTCERCSASLRAEHCTKHNDGRLKRFCGPCWAQKESVSEEHPQQMGEEDAPMTAEEIIATITGPEADAPKEETGEAIIEEENIQQDEEATLDLPQKEEKDVSEEHPQQIDEEDASMTAEETIATIVEPEAEASKEKTVEAIIEKKTENATEAQGTTEKDKRRIGSINSSVTQNEAGSHGANWTLAPNIIEEDSWMRFIWTYYSKTIEEIVERETWKRRTRHRYLKTVIEREAWAQFFLEYHVNMEPKDMEWWKWKMTLPKRLYYRERIPDKRSENISRLETQTEYIKNRARATREWLKEAHKMNAAYYGATSKGRSTRSQSKLRTAVRAWIDYTSEGDLCELHDEIKEITVKVWKEYTRDWKDNSKEESLRRFQEGAKILMKNMDRKIAEQIEEGIKEHFTKKAH